MLDVHKIQFIVANVGNIDELIKDIFEFLDSIRDQYDILDNEKLFSKLSVGSRWNKPKI